MSRALSSTLTSPGEPGLSARHLRAIRPEVRELARYAPPLADRSVINLSLNEHQVLPSAAVREALAAVDPMRLVTYDTELGAELRSRLAQREGVGVENVLVFAGSSSALQVLFSCLRPGPIVLPSLCWTYYRSLARLWKMPVAEYGVLQLADQFRVDHLSADSAIRKHKPACALFINPHMPTGALAEPSAIARTAELAPDTLVLADEAYHGFSEEAGSLANQVVRQPNLVVSRTFSKAFGLAGIRIGYLVGGEAMIEQLAKACVPFSVPYVSARVALAALASEDYYRDEARALMRVKARFAERVAAISGVHPYRSHGNFLLVDLEDEATAVRAERAIAATGILVRSAESYGLPSFLRISVGSAEAMDSIAATLEGLRAGDA